MQQQPPNPYSQQPNPYASPPPPPPMPPRRPNALARFLTWYRRQALAVQLIVGVLILGAVIFVCSAAASGIAQGSQDINPTPTTASASQPTQAPTSAPTAKPTATQTAKQRIAQLVHDNASNFSKIDMTQNDGKTVVAQITLNEALDKSSARAMIQENCFNVEQALWTAHIASLEDVDLAFRGPAVDKFGNNSTAPYGVCDLTKATAAKFNWGNLSPPTAWDAYDSAQFYTIIQG